MGFILFSMKHTANNIYYNSLILDPRYKFNIGAI